MYEEETKSMFCSVCWEFATGQRQREKTTQLSIPTLCFAYIMSSFMLFAIGINNVYSPVIFVSV
jgi:hypothetical protein